MKFPLISMELPNDVGPYKAASNERSQTRKKNTRCGEPHVQNINFSQEPINTSTPHAANLPQQQPADLPPINSALNQLKYQYSDPVTWIRIILKNVSKGLCAEHVTVMGVQITAGVQIMTIPRHRKEIRCMEWLATVTIHWLMTKRVPTKSA